MAELPPHLKRLLNHPRIAEFEKNINKNRKQQEMGYTIEEIDPWK